MLRTVPKKKEPTGLCRIYSEEEGEPKPTVKRVIPHTETPQQDQLFLSTSSPPAYNQFLDLSTPQLVIDVDS